MSAVRYQQRILESSPLLSEAQTIANIYGVHIVTVTGLFKRIPSTRIALSTGVPFPGAHWWRRSGITGHNQQTLTVTFPWWRAASATPPFFTATRIGLAIRMQTCINQVILHRHI
jgi:hypothetical protein